MSSSSEDDFRPPPEELYFEEVELLQAAAPLLERDLQATLDSRLRLVVEEVDGEAVCRISLPEAYVAIELRGEFPQDFTPADAGVSLARQAQESALFDDYFLPWPACPLHSGAAHSLEPRTRASEATWFCPVARRHLGPLGQLILIQTPERTPR